MRSNKELTERINKQAQATENKKLWLTETSVTQDNLHEWVDDLYIYTDEQLGWVMPRVLLVFMFRQELITATNADLHQLLCFLDAEKSPEDFPNEEDDWPNGELSQSKKRRFSLFSNELVECIAGWLSLLARFELSEDMDKEIASAIKFWDKQRR